MTFAQGYKIKFYLIVGKCLLVIKNVTPKNFFDYSAKCSTYCTFSVYSWVYMRLSNLTIPPYHEISWVIERYYVRIIIWYDWKNI